MLNTVTTGDTVEISSLDRLSRNYNDIKHLYNEIVKEKQCKLVVLDMPILNNSNDTLLNNFMNELILNVLAFVSENEREKIRERQKQGIETALKKGIKFGRPTSITESEFLYHYDRVVAGVIGVNLLCKELKISKLTFYNLKNKYIVESDINVPELIRNRKSTK